MVENRRRRRKGVMTEREIDAYLAGMRQWKTLPSDYDAKTEDIIRRILRGQLRLGPDYSEIIADRKTRARVRCKSPRRSRTSGKSARPAKSTVHRRKR